MWPFTKVPKQASLQQKGASFDLENCSIPQGSTIGLIAGSGLFPFEFIKAAKHSGFNVVGVFHEDETSKNLEQELSAYTWIKLGQVGSLIDTFKRHGVKHAAMVGGINRVKLFGGVRLDARGALLMAKIRSTKDDRVMRGLADELLSEGIEVVPSMVFMQDSLVMRGALTARKFASFELEDVEIGQAALAAMSAQDIGQLVVVKDGVITAVEAVEGSDQAILRGGKLAGEGAIVVKFSKPTQDLRFDVPTIGLRTIETMIQAKCRGLAVEAGKCLVLEREQMVALANQHQIAIVGI
ncbi:UDP-2,3-diacylglucosamine diphosphatase LpxI [bacterium]|nr:UDP-2,3-diacylglucosamine diphosphatase LpxI [bacterium]